MNRLRNIHLFVGILGFLAFVLTGQYMHWFHAHLYGMADGPRLLYRTSHIYILWASLLNLILGCYLSPLTNGFLHKLQAAAGIAIIAAPFLLTISFFAESLNHNLYRPFTRFAIYFSLAGTGLHFLATLRSRVLVAQDTQQNPKK